MRLGLSSARKALPTVAARTISSAGQLAPRVHDCVVVGGGISGLTTAFRLAEVFPSGIASCSIALRTPAGCSTDVTLLSRRRIPVSAETSRRGGKGSTLGERVANDLLERA